MNSAHHRRHDAPEATTVDTLGGATDIGKNILKARDAAAVRTLLNVAEKPAADGGRPTSE